MKYQNTWDLEAIFAGGTRSEDLQKKVKSVEVEVGNLKTYSMHGTQKTTPLNH